MLTLSVLDQIPVPQGKTPAQAIQESIALAQMVERLGYRRFWVAEHHGNYALACTTPEIITSVIAAHTNHIRIGTGGVILPHYSSFKIAETFCTLEALFPGRIDLGFGRGPGAGPQVCAALRSSALSGTHEEYAQQVQDLVGFVHNKLPPQHEHCDAEALPDGTGAPDLWLLGAGTKGVELAARLGLSFSFAQFIHKKTFPEVLATYRQQFRPSPWLSKPRASLAVRVLCADTEEEARSYALSFWLLGLVQRGMATLPLATGELLRLPSLEDASRYHYTSNDYAFMQEHELMMLVGTPEQLKARLLKLAQEYDVDELMLLTICPDLKTRVRSYQLLAQEFTLLAPASYTQYNEKLLSAELDKNALARRAY